MQAYVLIVYNFPSAEPKMLQNSNIIYLTNNILKNNIILFHFVSLSHKNINNQNKEYTITEQ